MHATAWTGETIVRLTQSLPPYPQKEDYGDFALDRKACVVAYRKIQSKTGGPVPDDIKLCVLGLEGSLSLEVRELTAERRAEIVQEVLTEQEEQWEEGEYDPDQIRLVSIRCSNKSAVEAFERAVPDKDVYTMPPPPPLASPSVSSSSRPPIPMAPMMGSSTGSRYQPPLAPHQFYGSGGGSPWGNGAAPEPQNNDSLVAPKRQISKRQMSRSSLTPRKEPSWRTTLTKQESIRETTSRLHSPRGGGDTQPMMPRKQPSLKKDFEVDTKSTPVEYTISGNGARDHRPKAVIRKPSVQFRLPAVQ